MTGNRNLDARPCDWRPPGTGSWLGPMSARWGHCSTPGLIAIAAPLPATIPASVVGAAQGLRIRYGIDTHGHNDDVSGLSELAARQRVTVLGSESVRGQHRLMPAHHRGLRVAYQRRAGTGGLRRGGCSRSTLFPLRSRAGSWRSAVVDAGRRHRPAGHPGSSTVPPTALNLPTSPQGLSCLAAWRATRTTS